MSAASSIQECPVCHQIIIWSNSQTVINRCESCKTIVARNKDSRAKQIDYSPVVYKNAALRIGYQGSFSGNPFRITGRVQISFESQTINYWTTINNKNQIALLAEGYGFYTWCEPITMRASITVGQLQSGNIFQSFELQDNVLAILEEKEKGYGFETDGECWFPFFSQKLNRYFLQTPDGDSFVVLAAESENIAAFKQTDIPVEQLFKTGTTASFETRQQPCPVCKKELLLKAFPYTKNYCCPYCKNGFYVETPFDQQKAFKADDSDWGRALQPGQKGKIDGVDFEVIGGCLKQEEGLGSVTWREYTLFNPLRGFLTLSEYDGHWMKVTDNPTGRPCAEALVRDNLLFNSEPFPEFNAYSFRVLDAFGEFPYNIFSTSGMNIREFISPPEMWIQQFNNKKSITWAHGTHLSPKHIETGFPGAVLPTQTGVGAVEPTGYINPAKLIVSTLTAVFLLFLLHHLGTIDRKEVNLITQRIQFADSSKVVSFVSDTFDLPRRKNIVSVDIFSAISNTWVYANFRLVNVKTGEEYNMGLGVEYYSGVDGGESWSEGSSSSNSAFVKIPRGRYLLQVDGEKEKPEAGSYISLYVNYDSYSNRNFWFAALFIIIWPVGRFLRDRYFESKRWGEAFFEIE